jgi:hypothetical protein
MTAIAIVAVGWLVIVALVGVVADRLPTRPPRVSQRKRHQEADRG